MVIGCDFDVVIQGDGLFVVQDVNGDEVYICSGNFMIDVDGWLLLGGCEVMGEGGVVMLLLQYMVIVVGVDGEIFVQVFGQVEMQVVDKFKFVKFLMSEMIKNVVGLFVLCDGGMLLVDVGVWVKGGYLEGSNVFVVEEMVVMMSLNCDFEVQMKFLNKVDLMVDVGNWLICE